MINLIKKIFLPKKISFKFISRRNFVSKIIDENKKKVSYEPSAERARKLYKDSMEIMNIDKIKSPGFSLKNLLRCNKIISNDSKYELIGSQSIIDEFIDKKFNDTNTNLLEIDRQYAQIQTEEINLFEQLGTKYYEDDYDDNIINDDNQLQNNDGNKNEKASLSDENDIESTVLATFDNMNMIKSNADLEINASDGNKNFKVELTSVGSEIENKNNQKEAKVSKKRGKKPIVKVNETISPIIPLEITLDQGSMSLTTFPSLTHQTEGNTLKNDLLRKKEVKITKKINKQNKDYIEPIKEEEKLNELKSNQHDSDIQTKKEYLSNLIEHDGPTKNKKDHIESNHQEESSIAKQAKKPRKRVSKKIEPVVNVKDGGVYDFDSYLKGLLINEFDYYNTTRFLANNMVYKH